MRVESFLDIIYKRNKKGELSYHAKNFIKKHNLNIEMELTRDDLICLMSKINNSDKRELILQKILSEIEEKQDLNLREISYKEACKYYHPDNKQSGSVVMFKFIQEVKEYLWEWNGKPVKNISGKKDWKEDRIFDNLSEEEQIKSFYDML